MQVHGTVMHRLINKLVSKQHKIISLLLTFSEIHINVIVLQLKIL